MKSKNTPRSTCERETPVTFLREPAVLARFACDRSLLRRRIAAGSFPRPVKLSARAAAWPSHEVDAMARAALRGDDLRALTRLVDAIHAERARA